MKKIIFLAIIFFAASAMAIGIESDKSVYTKEDTLKISGNCQTQPTISAISEQGLIVFSQATECEGNAFNFEYKSSFLDPTGSWVLSVLENNQSATKDIFVKDKREGGFLLVKFLSPASGVYQKNQKIIISAQITDAGSFVTDATAVAWGAKGERIELQNNGNGTYGLEYTLPLDIRKTDWPLVVLAQTQKENRLLGGSAQIDMKIEGAPIIIEILHPSGASFEQGDLVDFEVSAKYSNGELIDGNEVFILSGDHKVFLEKKQDTFKGVFQVPQDILGASEITIKAVDLSQNNGEKQLAMVISCSLTCAIKKYSLAGLVLVVAIIFLARFAFTKITATSKSSRLREEKEKTDNLIKDLQNDYFTKGIMPSESYKKKLADYRARLVQIEQELAGMQKQK